MKTFSGKGWYTCPCCFNQQSFYAKYVEATYVGARVTCDPDTGEKQVWTSDIDDGEIVFRLREWHVPAETYMKCGSCGYEAHVEVFADDDGQDVSKLRGSRPEDGRKVRCDFWLPEKPSVADMRAADTVLYYQQASAVAHALKRVTGDLFDRPGFGARADFDGTVTQAMFDRMVADYGAAGGCRSDKFIDPAPFIIAVLDDAEQAGGRPQDAA